MIRKFIRRNVYRWHRITGLIVAVPILLWTVSGFLHPVMGYFKPDVGTSVLPPDRIDPADIIIKPNDAFTANGINALLNFRIVKIHGSYFYQVQQPGFDTLTYVSCASGALLQDGDKKYAAYLAERFLNERYKKEKGKGGHHPASADMGAILLKPSAREKATVQGVELVSTFNSEYKASNVLLPVYLVQFNRKDRIRLYIETSTSRLAVAIDKRKAAFNTFFSWAHSWSFLDGMGMIKHIVLGMVSLLCFASSLFGFFVYNIIKKKKKGAAAYGKTRMFHQVTGNVFIITTLLFSISGAWHSLHKINSDQENTSSLQGAHLFTPQDIDLSLPVLLACIKGAKLSGISPVHMYGKNYWHLTAWTDKGKLQHYVDMKNNEILHAGEYVHGTYLASIYSGKESSEILRSAYLEKFTKDYSMMKKRLPVLEVQYKNGDYYYVEPSTNKLSSRITKGDRNERFSFSNLHMHHFWEDWWPGERGKSVRNIVLMGSTGGLLLLAVTGTMLYIRRRKKYSFVSTPA